MTRKWQTEETNLCQIRNYRTSKFFFFLHTKTMLLTTILCLCSFMRAHCNHHITLSVSIWITIVLCSGLHFFALRNAGTLYIDLSHQYVHAVYKGFQTEVTESTIMYAFWPWDFQRWRFVWVFAVIFSAFWEFRHSLEINFEEKSTHIFFTFIVKIFLGFFISALIKILDRCSVLCKINYDMSL